jgi:hypothetical protein
MTLLLSILTVVAVWGLLALLVFALVVLRKPLDATRTHLERVAMGVRAIEHQTEPFERWTKALTGGLADTGRAMQRLHQLLKGADR